MKRILAAGLAMLLLCTGCVGSGTAAKTDGTSSSTAGSSSTGAPDAYLAEYSDGWAYANLSKEQQTNYGAVYTAVQDGLYSETYVTIEEGGTPTPGITVPLPHSLRSEDELVELYNAFVRDNPVFFHVGTVYGYTGRQHGDDRRFTSIKLTYTMNAAQRKTAVEEFRLVTEELLSAVTPDMSAFRMELTLHDALTARCTYDTETAEADNPLENATAFTAYGALVEGRAVCEGYARAMQYLLVQAGIPATVVGGKDSDGHPHMWNMLLLDGAAYHLDVTWNDADPLGTYAYFNLSDTELHRSHTPDETEEWLPAAQGTQHNYYRMTASYLDTLRIDEIAGHIAEQLAAGENTVHLRFSDATFSNALFFVRSTAWFADTVSACMPEGAVWTGEYSYSENTIHKTVTIRKKPLDTGNGAVV